MSEQDFKTNSLCSMEQIKFGGENLILLVLENLEIVSCIIDKSEVIE
jgi:hypothetical protein